MAQTMRMLYFIRIVQDFKKSTYSCTPNATGAQRTKTIINELIIIKMIAMEKKGFPHPVWWGNHHTGL